MICCLAMLSGVSYGKLLEMRNQLLKANELDVDTDNEACTSRDAVMILKKLGIRSVFGITKRTLLKANKPAIILLKNPAKYHTILCHAVYWDGFAHVYDPDTGKRKPLPQNIYCWLQKAPLRLTRL